MPGYINIINTGVDSLSDMSAISTDAWPVSATLDAALPRRFLMPITDNSDSVEPAHKHHSHHA